MYMLRGRSTWGHQRWKATELSMDQGWNGLTFSHSPPRLKNICSDEFDQHTQTEILLSDEIRRCALASF